MTEEDWFRATDLNSMLNFLNDKLSERKSRLLAVASCRRIWHLIQVEKARECVETAE
jgi:hypothetical protein